MKRQLKWLLSLGLYTALLLSLSSPISLQAMSDDDWSIALDKEPPAQPPAPTSTQPIIEPSASKPSSSTTPSSDDDDWILTFDEPVDEPPVLPKKKTSGAAAAKEPEELSISLEIPVLGTLELSLFEEKDKAGKTVSGFKTYLPKRNSDLALGPLVLNDGEMRLVEDNLGYTAHATLFGKKGSVYLKSGPGTTTEEPPATETTPADPKKPKKKVYTKVTFGISFTNKPTLELIPGKTATINSVDLVLEKKQPTKLVMTTKMLKQDVIIVLEIGKGFTNAWTELKDVDLVDIIAPIRGTPLEKGKLSSFKLMIKNFTAKKELRPERPRTLLISGKANLAGVASLDDIQELQDQDIAINGTFTSKGEKSLKAEAKKLTLPIGTIDSAIISADLAKGKKSFTLGGAGKIDFPEIGTLNTEISATIDQKGIVFSSGIKQDIEFAGIDIKSITLKFSSADKSLSLIGAADIKGYKTTITLSKGKDGKVVAQAALLEKEIKPFASLNVPYVEDIALKDPTFSFEKNKEGYEIHLNCTLTLFGVPLKGEFDATSKGAKVLKVKAPVNWKLSDGVSGLKGTLFDDIKLDDLSFIFSSADYHDTEQDHTFRKGFNFVSKTTLSGQLAPAGKFAGKEGTTISLIGYIAANPIESRFTAQIGGAGIKLSDKGTLGSLELEIAGNPVPSFALLTTFIVKPSPYDDPLNLTVRISFSAAADFSIAGTMLGFWKNPFGISGLELGNVAAEVDANLLTVFELGPKSFGVGGEIVVGKKQIALYVKLPLAGGGNDFVLYGELKNKACDPKTEKCTNEPKQTCPPLEKDQAELTLGDIIQYATKTIGHEVNGDKLPRIGIRDVKIYIVPNTTSIGELIFERGFTLRGGIFFPGFEAYGNINASQDGLIAEAYCTPVHLGPLEITQSDMEVDGSCSVDMKVSACDLSTNPTAPVKHKEGTKNPRACIPARFAGGPLMSMTLALAKQQLFISGKIKLGEVFETQSCMDISSDGVAFDFITALGKAQYKKQGQPDKPLLAVRLKGKSEGNITSSDFDFKVDACFQQYLLQYLRDQVEVGIDQAQKEVKKALEAAEKEVREQTEKAQAQVQAGIATAQAKVDDAKKSLSAIDDAIKKEKDAIEKAQADVNSATDTLNNIDCKLAGFTQQLGDVFTKKLVAQGILEGAKQASTGTLLASKSAAQGALDAANKTLDAAEQTAVGTIEVGKQAGTGVLIGTKVATVGMLEGAKQFINRGVLGLVDVQKIRYSGSLKQIEKGILGNVELSLVLVGQSMSMKMDIDITDPFKNIEAIAKTITNTIVESFIK
ncbi:MAG: hypothetical protein NTX86_03285 [Candidatus Dependentiae bacterium]|nr:hypothetical protein [Candidatus Dependentiae bacterium]